MVAHYEYDAWGNQLSSSAPMSGGFAYLFVGALGVRYDSATGLHYMRNRWYDAGLGRFLSRDALGGANRYAYCYSNPVDLVDVDGLQPTTRQKYNTLYNYFQTHRKRDCKSFIAALRKIGSVSGNCDEFMLLTRALFVPNNALPQKHSGWDPETMVRNAAIDRYAYPIDYQSPIINFYDSDWRPQYQDYYFRHYGHKPYANQSHHLGFFLGVGFYAPSDRLDALRRYAVTYEENTRVDTRNHPEYPGINYPDLRLSLIGINMGNSLKGCNDCSGPEFENWLNQLEDILCQ